MASLTDPTPSRATFNVPYPTSDETINKNFSGKSVNKKNLIISQNWDNYQGITFQECKPKYNKEKRSDSALISNCSFKDCVFHKCFMGSTTYIGVTFTNCTFESTDFMNAMFENCNFTGCTFENCTSWRVSFRNTVISATSFLKGATFPSTNYVKTIPQLPYYKFKHQKNRLDYACELIKSASDKFDSNLIDQAMYRHRIELARYYFTKIKNSSNYNSGCMSFLKRLWDLLTGIQISLICLCTNGGTSFTKVLIVSAVMIFVANPLILSQTELSTIFDPPVFINTQDYWLKVVIGIEAFMGFGYGEIKTTSPQDKYYLVSLPIMGFLLLSLFLHTLIKKVFR